MTDAPVAEAEPWLAPTVSDPVAATISLPGSKSLTNRLLVLAALSEHGSRIVAPLRARDTRLMAAALRALGTRIEDDGEDWVVTPAALHGGSIDCGLAGTVMRFLPPVAALALGASTFDGDPHARTRPMGTLLDGLRQAGVDISDDGDARLPFTVHGTGSVRGGEVTLDASASSQFVSGLLLSAARFTEGIDIRHVGPTLPSLPHIEMSVLALRAAGVTVDDSEPQRWRVMPGPIRLVDTVVEPDLSNAAPFLAAALVTGGTVTVRHWPARTTQPGALLPDLLARMGAEISHTADGLRVTGTGQIEPLVADLHEASELTPVLAGLAALSEGESRICGVAHIRGHETDRLAALRTELTRLGGEVTETEDGLIIHPTTLHAGAWQAYADHRMAQAAAVIGLRVPGVVVDDIGCTTKTIADFPGLWRELLATTAVSESV